MIELEEPGVYNTILRKLKEKLLKRELGGERKDFWYEVRKNRLGLVDKKASESSDVSEDEAREVSIVFRGHQEIHWLTVVIVQFFQMIPQPFMYSYYSLSRKVFSVNEIISHTFCLAPYFSLFRLATAQQQPRLCPEAARQILPYRWATVCHGVE